MKVQIDCVAKSVLAALIFVASESAIAFPSSYRAYGPSVEDMRRAGEQATREGKLILIYFKTARCAPCRYVDGEFDSTRTQNVFVGKYVFVEAWIGGGDGGNLGAKYGITGAPHFVVLGPDGSPRCKAVRGFENQMQAQELGAGLTRVKVWPAWPEPVASAVSPKCLDIIRQIGPG